jgi:uncharacterized protein DUF222
MFEVERARLRDAACLDAGYARTRAHLNDMAEMPPGQTLLAHLMALRNEPVDATDAIRVDALWHKLQEWLAAQRMIVTQDAVNGGGHLPGLQEHERAQIVAQEMADATNIGYAAAAAQVELTLTVARALHTAWTALDRGELSMLHVKRLARALEHCKTWLAERIDAIVVPLAVERGWTPRTIAEEAAKLVIRLDPDGAADRAATGRQDSDIRFYPEPDDMASLHARGSAPTVRQVKDTIEARAVQMGRDGDSRSIGERRIAALREFVLGLELGPDGAGDSGPTTPLLATAAIRPPPPVGDAVAGTARPVVAVKFWSGWTCRRCSARTTIPPSSTATDRSPHGPPVSLRRTRPGGG